MAPFSPLRPKNPLPSIAASSSPPPRVWPGSAALWSALGTRTWAATAGSASDAPEVADLNFGIIALTDCSPIVIAREKGFFKKYGINATVTKGANWAAIRAPARSRRRTCSSACRSPRRWDCSARRKSRWSFPGS